MAGVSEGYGGCCASKCCPDSDGSQFVEISHIFVQGEEMDGREKGADRRRYLVVENCGEQRFQVVEVGPIG